MNTTEYRKIGLRRRWRTLALDTASPDTNKATLVQRGFTIVELLIVIVVIAILAAISIVAYTGIQERAVNSRTISSVNQSVKLLNMYYQEHGKWPIDPDGPATSPGGSSSGASRYCLGRGLPNGRCADMGAVLRREPEWLKAELNSYGQLPGPTSSILTRSSTIPVSPIYATREENQRPVLTGLDEYYPGFTYPSTAPLDFFNGPGSRYYVA